MLKPLNSSQIPKGEEEQLYSFIHINKINNFQFLKKKLSFFAFLKGTSGIK